jgi:carbon storage regulator CsrA
LILPRRVYRRPLGPWQETLQGGLSMLVLSRKVNEEIVIADNIRIKLVKIAGGRARLAISAPREIGVRRAELPQHAESKPTSSGANP